MLLYSPPNCGVFFTISRSISLIVLMVGILLLEGCKITIPGNAGGGAPQGGDTKHGNIGGSPESTGPGGGTGASGGGGETNTGDRSGDNSGGTQFSGPQGNGEGYQIIKRLEVQQDSSANFDIAKRDDGTSLSVASVSIVTNPSKGSLAGAISSPTGQGPASSYTPNAGYVGQDKFEYNILTTDGATYTISVDVDVQPCLRITTQRSNSSHLHVIGLYETLNRASPNVSVTIGRQNEPAILYFFSYETVHWKLSLEEGAQVDRVIVYSYYPSTVEGVPSSKVQNLGRAPAYAYGWEPRENDGGGSFRDMMESVRSRENLNETSFQGCYEGSSFRIPYTSASLANGCGPGTRPSHYTFANQSCSTTRCQEIRLAEGPTHFQVDDRYTSPTDPLTIALGGLDITGGRDLSYAQVKATVARSCGKLYYEMQIFSALDNGWENSIGVTPSDSDSMTNGSSYDAIYTYSGTTGYIGIALDLEAGTIQYNVNGSRGPAASLNLGAFSPVFPTVGFSGGTHVKMNMGASSFHYTLPVGFVAYQ